MLRTIIFGTGTYLKKRVGILPKEFNILAFADNNSSLWGQDFFGKKIISPDVILKFTYDIIIIAVSNKFFEATVSHATWAFLSSLKIASRIASEI